MESHQNKVAQGTASKGSGLSHGIGNHPQGQFGTPKLLGDLGYQLQ